MRDGNSTEANDVGTDRTPESGPEFALLPPEHIRRNPKNPRQFFVQNTIEGLAESIASIGVQVPITVYAEAGEEGTTHVLLDGERRWLAATLIDLPAVPAWVVPKPSDVDNVLRMFNIHMLREEWSEIATAWALESLMDELDEVSPKRLHEVTGLSTDRIANMRTVLAFPRAYQERVAAGDLPFQFLVELDKAVLRHVRRDRDAVMGKTEEELRDVFVAKYERGTVGDVVDLRKVGKLIRSAKEAGYTGEQAKEALAALVTDPDMTIEEAFEAGAAANLEMRKVMRDIHGLPRRVAYLLTAGLAAEQREELLDGLRALGTEIEVFLGTWE